MINALLPHTSCSPTKNLAPVSSNAVLGTKFWPRHSTLETGLLVVPRAKAHCALPKQSTFLIHFEMAGSTSQLHNSLCRRYLTKSTRRLVSNRALGNDRILYRNHTSRHLLPKLDGLLEALIEWVQPSASSISMSALSSHSNFTEEKTLTDKRARASSPLAVFRGSMPRT